jgi:hypothetical protein
MCFPLYSTYIFSVSEHQSTSSISWSDTVLSQTYPRLASFARNEGASVLEVMQAEDLESLFLLPLSQQAFEELENLQAQLQDLPYDVDAADRWTPIWGNHYTSR